MSKFGERFCTVHMPLIGSGSALIFSTSITNPRLFRRLFSPFEAAVANCLWFNAHIGTGLYIYSRRHIMAAPSTPRRIIFSVFGAVLFNFGTVLFWAASKAVLPESDLVRTVFGLGSGVLFFGIGKEYLSFVDKQLGLA